MAIISAFICLLIVLFFLYKSSISQGIEINHITTFSIGWLYYWLLPIFLYRFEIFSDMILPFKEDMERLNNTVQDKSILIYTIYILVIYLIFILGDYVAKVKIKPTNQMKLYLSDKLVLNIFYFILLPVVIFFAYQFKDYFFTGYTKLDWFRAELKGQFVTLSLLLFILYLFYTVNKNFNKLEYTNKKDLLMDLFLNKFFITYLFVGIYIVSMGGRLYFMTSIMVMIVYYTVYVKKIKYSLFIRYAVILFVLMILVGVWRNSGQVSLDFTNIYTAIFAESILVGISLFNFIQYDFTFLINKPLFLMSDFVNIIPRFIFPNKDEFILNFADYGYEIYSPGGALNSFLSFVINFGIIGNLLFFFLLGFLLRYIRNTTNILGRVSYIFISGILTFSFFRDPFNISIVKLVVQFGIIVPVVIFIIIKVYSNRKKEVKTIDLQ